MRQAVYLAFAGATGPVIAAVLLILAYQWDQYSRVTTDFAITRVVVNPSSESIYGSFNKVRSCRFRELVAQDTDGHLYKIDATQEDTYKSRPLGHQQFGPWTISVQPGISLKILAVHRCNPLWERSEVLGTFENLK